VKHCNTSYFVKIKNVKIKKLINIWSIVVVCALSFAPVFGYPEVKKIKVLLTVKLNRRSLLKLTVL
jgi:hypothetical protein